MAQFGRPISRVTAGGWTGGAIGLLYDYIDEVVADDGDFIYTTPNPTADECEVALTASLTDPESSSDHIVRFRHQHTQTGTGAPATMTVTVKLYQGATLIASSAAESTALETWATSSFTLTGGEADSITDYTDLRFRILGVQTGGARDGRVRVSWTELEIPSVASGLAIPIASYHYNHHITA